MKATNHFKWKSYKMGFHDWEIDDPILNLDVEEIIGRFGNKFTELLTLITKHDPAGIIFDYQIIKSEYLPETKTIIIQLDKCKTKNEIHNLVHGEFARWFSDENGLYEKLSPLAEDIFEWKTNLNRNLIQEYCDIADSLTREFVENKERKKYDYESPLTYYILAYMLNSENDYLDKMIKLFTEFDYLGNYDESIDSVQEQKMIEDIVKDIKRTLKPN